ncbi:MAG: molybdopterin-binding protein, partial [Brachybacterium sp.]|nr:molybdopterin-binding protein [Brachybacterium sp.]
VVVTGDELSAEADLPGSVRESNGAMLAAALRADGAEALPPLHSGDDHAGLRETLARAAADSDLVLTTGGIGHGAFDVVKTLLGEHGSSTSRFAHLALRPGGPQGWGRLDGGVPVVHLPGTPVGALVGYHLFVRPLLAGTDAAVATVALGDVTADTARRRPGAVHALAGRLRLDEDGREVVDLLPGRRLAPYGRADALVLRGAPGAEDGWARVVRL